MRPLRAGVLNAVLALTLASCEPRATTETAIPPLPPPALQEPGTGTGGANTGDTVSRSLQEYRGALLDGTDYVITLRQDREEDVTLDYAEIVYQPTGQPLIVVVGRATNPVPGSKPTFDDGVFREFAGDWVIEVRFDETLLGEIGSTAADVVLSSIDVVLRNGFPALVIEDPFVWDPNGRFPPEVRYETFVVRPGCGTLAVECSDRKVIQVIPAQSLYPGTPALFGDVVSVDTESPRPVANPTFLDPGPLSPRSIPDVVWTGTEMIVWGGGDADDPYLIDGARFDPNTNEWRMLPPLPVTAQRLTRSVWVDGRLVVLSSEQTSAWNPEADAWETLEPNGLEPPQYPGFLQAIGSNVFLWNKRGVFVLDVADEQPKWTILPDSPLKPVNFRFSRRWLTAMTTSGDILYLSARSETGCGERLIVAWDGEQWRTLPSVSLETADRPDCSYANQIGGTPDGLVVWNTFEHLTFEYSTELDSWREIERFPLPGSEQVSGEVPLGGSFFLVPQLGVGAVFDGANSTWTIVEIPGPGTETDMVWTGTELLSWSNRSSADSWRWTPDQITLVNSATTR